MGGGFHYYFDAARALWDMSSQELYSIARTGPTEPVQRAAELALRLKAEYVTPEAFRDERSALTRLASALSDDPDFTIDVALTIGNRRRATTRVPPDIQWTTRRSPKTVLLWVAVTSAVVLLALDVLATAGVPVPTPIGDLLDRISGEDYAPQTPAPPTPAGVGGREHFHPPSDPAVDDEAIVLARPIAAAPNSSSASSETKNAHQANGKELNFQRGKERNFQKGKREHQPEKPPRVVHTSSSPPSSYARERARRLEGRMKPKKGKR